MNKIATTTRDLVPISQRLGVLRIYRLVVVALVAALWLGDPATRGAPARLVAAVTVGYVAAALALEFLWRLWRPPGRALLGVLVMLDAVYLAWVSYGTAGLDSPVYYLILLQLTTVSLIASWRTGVKLALFDSLLLLSAYYAERAGILTRLGNPHVRLGAGYRDLVITASVFWVIAIATSTLAAINERELRRRRYDLEALARLALRLEAVDEPSAVGAVLLTEVAEAFGYERAVLVQQSQGQLVPLAWHGAPPGEDVIVAPFDPMEAPVVTGALEENRTTLVAREQAETDAVIAACAVSTRKAIVVPLHADRALGALVVEHGAGHGSKVERRVVSMLERFCSHTSLVLSNVTLLMQMRDQATTDMLTGLANRRALEEALGRACAYAAREHEPLSLAMVDIDHFKAFNDTHGHQLGDRVLQFVGKTLGQQTRASDVTARYGGEEFCVLMPGIGIEAAAETSRRLCAAITEASGGLAVTASAGVASLEVGGTAEALVSAADAALYAAKRAGRNRVDIAGTGPSEPSLAAPGTREA